MATALLIDTDMVIDDAAALALALGSAALEVRAVVSVGGRVTAEQAAENAGRVLAALAPARMPSVAVGLNPAGERRIDRCGAYGKDGLGNCELPQGRGETSADWRGVYRAAIDGEAGKLTVLALGPLTNVAKILEEDPDRARRIGHLCISGGAVWARGDASPSAEFNFHADPAAAARVLSSGLPITVVPRDVSRLVCLDESNAAHLASSGQREGEVLARLLRCLLEDDGEPGYGKCHVHDALAAASLLWPELFLKTRMRLEVVVEGAEAGRSKPAMGGDRSKQIGLLTAVNATDVLENMLEALCDEAFVV